MGVRINRLAASTAGVNFINVLSTNFSYEHCFSTYVLAYSKNLYKKIRSLNVDEIEKLTKDEIIKYNILNLVWTKKL